MRPITVGPGPNPTGLCLCGCGEKTSIASRSDAVTGDVKGTPKRYLPHHRVRVQGHPLTYGVLGDAVWLRARYIDHAMTAREIAEEVGCDKGTVLNALKRHGIQRRPNHHRPQLKAGDRFGQLTVIEPVPHERKGRFYRCVCDCGREKVVEAAELVRGGVKSCECLRTQHGHAKGYRFSRTYSSWRAMKGRCLSPTHTAYRYYGGRGIKVCDRWLAFKEFLEDMGERPEGMTLDRIDPDGDYEPDNCRWVTWDVQCQNKRPRAKAREAA